MEALSFAAVWLFYNPIIGAAVFLMLAAAVFYVLDKVGALA